jgi:hypothetical protein
MKKIRKRNWMKKRRHGVLVPFGVTNRGLAPLQLSCHSTCVVAIRISIRSNRTGMIAEAFS